jgi:hypothetical protein
MFHGLYLMAVLLGHASGLQFLMRILVATNHPTNYASAMSDAL